MKLETKHIAPYLPYGLSFYNCRDYEKDYLQGIKANCYNVKLAQGSRDNDYFRLEDIKLILRNLSDLTKEIEHNGEKFVPIDKLLLMYECDAEYDFIESLEDDWRSANEKMPFIPYSLMQKLLEWHFDIFGLIEQGLAVDFNSLTKQ